MDGFNVPHDFSTCKVHTFSDTGLLMSIDIPQERGLGHADFSWGDESRCRFPLFDFLTVLPLNWMFMVYLTMLIGKTF